MAAIPDNCFAISGMTIKPKNEGTRHPALDAGSRPWAAPTNLHLFERGTAS